MTTPTLPTLTPFARAYIMAALWTFDDDAPCGMDYRDTGRFEDLLPLMDADTSAKMQADCAKFEAENAALLAKAGDDEQNGHDFWLTRNHHGAGFWDRGYDEGVSDALTDAAHKCGECNLYRGDDGRIYAS